MPSEKKAQRMQNPECPNCGSTNVETRVINDEFLYGSGPDTVKLRAAIPFRRCMSCGFEYTDSDAEDLRHEAVCRHLRVVTPKEVSAVRKKYGLNREEFAAITRIGEASLARWESGQVIQNAAYDNFLYLLTFEDVFARLRQRESSNPVEEVTFVGRKAEPVENTRQDSARRPRFRCLNNLEEASRRSSAFRLRPGINRVEAR